jgi:hypothetical protein
MVGRIILFIDTSIMYELILLIGIMVTATILITIFNDR